MASTAGMATLPDDKTIAFAVSIVRSKPGGLTIQEYIAHLRQHVAQGRRGHALSSQHRHLDRSSYWRSEYERQRDACEAIEEENIRLQREVAELKGQAKAAKPSAAGSKRKKGDEDVISVPRSPKRTKGEGGADRTPFVVAELDFELKSLGGENRASREGRSVPETNSSEDADEMCGAASALMTSMYRLHSILKPRGNVKTDAPALSHQLVETATALEALVSRAMHSDDASSTPDTAGLKTILTVVARSLQAFRMGYSRLGHGDQGCDVLGRVTYAVVRFYAEVLHRMEKIARSEAQTGESGDGAAKSSPQKPASSLKNTGRQQQSRSGMWSVQLNLLTGLIAREIEHLSTKPDLFRALFEGLAFVIIEQLGSRLYTLTFEHRRPASLEQEIATCGEPTTTPPAQTADVAAAKLEAPYLMHLLKRLMSAAPSHFGGIGSGGGGGKGGGKPKTANGKTATKSSLAIVAKERLQRTLINSMFGADETDLEDPFMDCLTMPVRGAGALDTRVPKVKQWEVREWFQGEVWRVLGWEILARDGDW